MTKQSTTKINVCDAIALCQVIEQYSEFHQNLLIFLSSKKNRESIDKLEEAISLGKSQFKSKQLKQFYDDNKLVIDTINKHSRISNFIHMNYCWDTKSIEYINSMYEYILRNKDKKDKILAVLDKVKQLGFTTIEFNENLDFCDEEHYIYTLISDNTHAVYLDNLEAIPSYDNSIIKYKSNGSNYKIITRIFGGFKYPYDKKIVLNDLTFDAKRLPESITKENTFDKIVELQETKKEEYSIIRNSVDLGMSVEDLFSTIDNVDKIIDQLQNVDSKEELKKLLLIIRNDVSKIQELSNAYDISTSNSNEFITQSLLEEEKQAYKRKRENSKIHI